MPFQLFDLALQIPPSLLQIIITRTDVVVGSCHFSGGKMFKFSIGFFLLATSMGIAAISTGAKGDPIRLRGGVVAEEHEGSVRLTLYLQEQGGKSDLHSSSNMFLSFF